MSNERDIQFHCLSQTFVTGKIMTMMQKTLAMLLCNDTKTVLSAKHKAFQKLKCFRCLWANTDFCSFKIKVSK